MYMLPERRRMGGISLIELVFFIVIVSVGVAGLLSVYGPTVRSSVDPLQRKQALSIAESLLAEIEQQAFTYCDPADSRVFIATGTADCTGGAATSQNKANAAALSVVTGPMPATESRSTFNNVADYGGFATANIPDAAGGNAMAGYNASVTITRAAGIAPFASVTDDLTGRVLRIAVTVTRGGESVTLTGYRFRYAPNVPG